MLYTFTIVLFTFTIPLCAFTIVLYSYTIYVYYCAISTYCCSMRVNCVICVATANVPLVYCEGEAEHSARAPALAPERSDKHTGEHAWRTAHVRTTSSNLDHMRWLHGEVVFNGA